MILYIYELEWMNQKRAQILQQYGSRARTLTAISFKKGNYIQILVPKIVFSCTILRHSTTKVNSLGICTE